MKKVVLSGISKFDVINCPVPDVINSDDVLLKINSVGVCGSDIHYFKEGKIGDQVILFPFTIGHECCATVVNAGKDVQHIRPGDIVAVEPAVSCYHCSQCMEKREHTCQNLKFLGCPGQLEGCLAEYLIMPERNCFPFPNNINIELAALVEPLSIGCYAANFVSDLNVNSTIAILGAGPIGLSVMFAFLSKGFKNIFVTDKLDYRINAAKSSGARWTGNPNNKNTLDNFLHDHSQSFDAVFECCGQQEALDFGVDVLKPGGKLLIIGIPETDRVTFDISKLRRKEILIQNVRRQNRCTNKAIELIASGKFSFDSMITHTFPFNQTEEAFNLVSNYQDNVIKALIKF
ncbi:MAG: alcohol dehydrogenase catalytic domain-containing protein [Ignavibacteriaceae bacterium]